MWCGMGTAKSMNGARDATETALGSPLLEIPVESTRNVLFNITGSKDMALYDVAEASGAIEKMTDRDAHIVYGAVYDNKLAGNEYQATVYVVHCPAARGGDKSPLKRKKRPWGYDEPIDPGECAAGWIPGRELRYTNVPELTETYVPRSDGKRVCNYLKKLRTELARANNIPYESEKCTSVGPCAGTCAKCDQEAAYLRDKLNEIPEHARKYPRYILEDWKKVL